MLPPPAPAALGGCPGQRGTCHLFPCVTSCCRSHQPGGDEPQILLPRVEHRRGCHPGDHLDGIWRESAASGEDACQLGTVSNAISREFQTSSLRVTFLPADVASPGFQPLCRTVAMPGSIKALHGFFHSWLCKHPAPAPAGCICLRTPLCLPAARAPAARPSTAWVNGRQLDGKGPFLL